MFYHEKKIIHSFKLRFLFIKIQVTFSGKAKLLYNLECLSETFLGKRYFQLPIQDQRMTFFVTIIIMEDIYVKRTPIALGLLLSSFCLKQLRGGGGISSDTFA